MAHLEVSGTSFNELGYLSNQDLESWAHRPKTFTDLGKRRAITRHVFYVGVALIVDHFLDHQYGEVLGPAQLRSPPLNSDFQDLSGLPPRKRIHHMIPGYDVMSNPLQAQNMTLQP